MFRVYIIYIYIYKTFVYRSNLELYYVAQWGLTANTTKIKQWTSSAISLM